MLELEVWICREGRGQRAVLKMAVVHPRTELVFGIYNLR